MNRQLESGGAGAEREQWWGHVPPPKALHIAVQCALLNDYFLEFVTIFSRLAMNDCSSEKIVIYPAFVDSFHIQYTICNIPTLPVALHIAQFTL